MFASRTTSASVDPDALKMPARRAQYSLTENARFPFHAEPTHCDVRRGRGGKTYRLPHIASQLARILPAGAIADDEFYVHSVPLQTIVSLATPADHDQNGRAKNQVDSDEARK